MGSFSAGSNVTGRLSKVEAICVILHRYGFYAFCDYAGAGPYVVIDMSNKDAVFLSPHKLVGGPGGAGVLVAKQHMFRNRIPTVAGGGKQKL